VTAWGIT
jgi:hypothetical protein